MPGVAPVADSDPVPSPARCGYDPFLRLIQRAYRTPFLERKAVHFIRHHMTVFNFHTLDACPFPKCPADTLVPEKVNMDSTKYDTAPALTPLPCARKANHFCSHPLDIPGVLGPKRKVEHNSFLARNNVPKKFELSIGVVKHGLNPARRNSMTQNGAGLDETWHSLVENLQPGTGTIYCKDALIGRCQIRC